VTSNKNNRYFVTNFIPNCFSDNVKQGIEKVVKEKWFQQVLSNERFDAILVLAHFDLLDPLLDVIRKAIRNKVGDEIPVVFITGHTHYRGAQQIDDSTFTFEAGRYMDTVGFVSFPKKESVRGTNSSSLFSHKFIDTNRDVLFLDTLNLPAVEQGRTKNGKDLSDFIQQTRQKLGLEKEIGCAPKQYYYELPVDSEISLWGLYRDEVIPKIFFSSRQTMITIKEESKNKEDNLPMAMLLSKDSWRYDIYDNAPLVEDDIISIAPFNETVVYLGTFPAHVILQANQTLNEYSDGDDIALLPSLPKFILIGTPQNSENDTLYDLFSHDFGADTVQQVLNKIGEKTVIKPTDFRSTMIWMAYVAEYWACDGTGQLPQWFPTPESVLQNLSSDERTDYKKLLLFLVLALVILGLLVTALGMMIILFQNYVGYQPGTFSVEHDDEINFHDEGRFDNGNPVTSMGSEGLQKI
jgi:hypothetical protein